jgi:hypothetical protein
MKSIILSVLMILPAFADADSSREDFQKKIESCDFYVKYDPYEKTMDIGVRVRGDRTSFRPFELQNFFDSQRHKNSVVVILDKNNLEEEDKIEFSKQLEDIKNYFIVRGYSHIAIGQANGGGSPLPLLEYHNKAEQGGTGQPATASESKSNGSQNPQPESKPASR